MAVTLTNEFGPPAPVFKMMEIGTKYDIKKCRSILGSEEKRL